MVGGRSQQQGQQVAARRSAPSVPQVLLAAVVVVLAPACASQGTTELGATAPTSSTQLPVPTFVPGAPSAQAVVPDTTLPVDAPGQRLGVGPCPMFPADHVFNTPVTGLPVHPASDRTVAAIGRERDLRHGFSSTVFDGTRRGYPINVVDPTSSTPTDFMVSARYLYFSDGEDVPMPAVPRFEGWPGRQWDKHLLIVDTSTCRTRELLNVQPPGENDTARPFGKWYADAIVSFDLRSTGHPVGSANAAGVSMLAGLVRYDEVASGRIHHALGITMSDIGAGDPVWPALRTDGRSTNPDAPPMGSWFRLRSDVDTSTLGPQARVVARALQEYGAILVDTGPGITITGEPDLRWNDEDLRGLASLGADDLELVDVSSVIVDPDSHRARRG